MNVKKHFGADLEKKKKSFLAIGLLFSLAIVLAAFEYRTYDYKPILEGTIPILTEEEIVIINTIPEAPPPPKEKVFIDFKIDDNVNEEEPIEILSLEIDESTSVEMLEPIELPEEIIIEDNAPMNFPQVFPEFEGGYEAMILYFKKSIKYPKQAIHANRQGKVHLTFVVEKDGSISNVELVRGIGYGCDEEAIRVVNQMPKWKPGKQLNKAVRVQFNLPIAFKLR